MNVVISFRSAARCLLLLLALLGLSYQAILAQSLDGCNEGRSPDWKEDPRDFDAVCLPEVARRYGNLECLRGAHEEYGYEITNIADANGDGIEDYIVVRWRCDTISTGGSPFEVFLHYTNFVNIPEIDQAQRIGVSEVNFDTWFVAAGDFDGDTRLDICVRVSRPYDTSFGANGYTTSRVIVFWGQQSGVYTVSDTTRLECGADIFLSMGKGINYPYEGHDALVVRTGGGYTRGVGVVILAQLFFYTLHQGERWGRNGVPRMPTLAWWNAPSNGYAGTRTVFGPYMRIDHDGDGALDIAMTTQSAVAKRVWAGVLYGRRGALPDTSEFEFVVFDSAHGTHAKFVDITGDRIPELVVMTDEIQSAWIYAGYRGQRLNQQYGSGNDAGVDRLSWARPWARIRLARSFKGIWRGIGTEEFYDLGDGDGDGIADLWIWLHPYLLCYGTGDHLDDYADALAYIGPGGYLREGRFLHDERTGQSLQIVGTADVLYYFEPTPFALHKRPGYARYVPPELRRQPGVVPVAGVAAGASCDRFTVEQHENTLLLGDMLWSSSGAVSTAQLYTVGGELVSDHRIERSSTAVDLSGLPAGVYLVVLTPPAGSTCTRLLTVSQ